MGILMQRRIHRGVAITAALGLGGGGPGGEADDANTSGMVNDTAFAHVPCPRKVYACMYGSEY